MYRIESKYKCLIKLSYLEYFENNCIFIQSKELSDLRSGAVFGEWDYYEGLKFGNFRYCMCRSKCFGPNETNFMDFPGAPR